MLKRKHPNIDTLSHSRLQSTLEILDKFCITAYEACKDPHVFCMNPISMDNYGEILRECGFVNIIPKHIIRLVPVLINYAIVIGYHKRKMNPQEGED